MEQLLLQIYRVLESSWDILLDSSPFIISGFIVAGLLKAFLPDDLVNKHLGKGKISSVLKSSLVGVPIPLCSCGVLPAAAGLKEQGASKGAVTSFMISTPETGVDSIAITYALLDSIMTVVRPLAAFITAITTGLFVNMVDTDEEVKVVPLASSCCTQSSCGAGDTNHETIWGKIKSGMSFSFGDLVDDIGAWLLIGVLLAGIIGVFISAQVIETYLGSGLFSLLFMLVLATPLYVCATASTPIAAALVLKGLSPGAALVFLLAGPATNVATITVISKVIGKKATVIYVASIMICSLVIGLAVNYLYALLGIDILSWVTNNEIESHGAIAYASTFILLLFIARGFIKSFLKPLASKMNNQPA